MQGKKKSLLTACVLSFLCMSEPGWSAQNLPQNQSGVPQRTLPFSSGILVGDTLYLSGHLGVNPKTKEVPIDPEEEIKAVLGELRKTIEAADMSMDDLVSVDVFCANLSFFEKFNKIYKGVLREPYPARAFVGVKKLLYGAHIEVQGIAIRGAKVRKTLVR